MQRQVIFWLGLVATIFVSSQAFAITLVQGKIVKTEGHEAPTCRRVTLKRDDNGQLMTFRIPSAIPDETGIMAVSLTALVSRLTVEVGYDADQTSGCGSEPRIRYITLIANP